MESGRELPKDESEFKGLEERKEQLKKEREERKKQLLETIQVTKDVSIEVKKGLEKDKMLQAAYGLMKRYDEKFANAEKLSKRIKEIREENEFKSLRAQSQKFLLAAKAINDGYHAMITIYHADLSTKLMKKNGKLITKNLSKEEKNELKQKEKQFAKQQKALRKETNKNPAHKQMVENLKIKAKKTKQRKKERLALQHKMYEETVKCLERYTLSMSDFFSNKITQEPILHELETFQEKFQDHVMQMNKIDEAEEQENKKLDQKVEVLQFKVDGEEEAKTDKLQRAMSDPHMKKKKQDKMLTTEMRTFSQGKEEMNKTRTSLLPRTFSGFFGKEVKGSTKPSVVEIKAEASSESSQEEDNTSKKVM